MTPRGGTTVVGVEARDKNGTTMLHAACRSGSFLMVQEQRARQIEGSSVNVLSFDGLF